jgi:hypothetical protein
MDVCVDIYKQLGQEALFMTGLKTARDGTRANVASGFQAQQRPPCIFRRFAADVPDKLMPQLPLLVLARASCR